MTTRHAGTAARSVAAAASAPRTIAWSSASSTRIIARYFGVTAGQAGRSGLSTYAPSAGLRDIGLVVALAYQLDGRWIVLGHARATRLLGDASRSPVVARRENGQVGTFLVYRF